MLTSKARRLGGQGSSLADAQSALDALVRGTRKEAEGLARKAAAGEITPSSFGDQMSALLEDRHTLAVVLGRHHAGDRTPQEDDDKRFAELIVDGESEFLAGFVSDLQSGRYEEKVDGAAVRARLYASRLTGTANEVVSLTQPAETVWAWVLGASEQHCPDCPRLASEGPYSADKLPTVPGAGGTACLGNCTCAIQAGDVGGFVRTE